MSDEEAKYQIDELCEAIADKLEPLLEGNAQDDVATLREELFGVWSELEAVLHRDNYPDVSESDAVAFARVQLDCAGFDAARIANFIETCRSTGASWRTMQELAMLWNTFTL